jgi:hypothetical protein
VTNGELPAMTGAPAVVAAHPDDESGVPVTVLCFTYGEASTLHGACNPASRTRALDADREIGLLPCNVIVRADLPMSAAVGTSLVIIAINSLASLVARTGYDHVDWTTTVPFALAAMAASLAGKKAADHVPEKITTRAFAALILLVAAYTTVRTLSS